MSSMRRLPAAVIALALLTLAGCALQRTVPGTAVAWEQRRVELQQLSSWSLRGRLAVKAAEGGGQGAIQWNQSADAASIRLSGPFGAGGYEILWNDEEVVVTDGKGQVRAAYQGAEAATEFLREQLGWAFPAVNARYWVLGVPAPGSRARERFDPDGWLVAIEQQGWVIGYQDFIRRGEDWMPRKITLENPQGHVRLVLDKWQPER
jgi:outer membrane lipoprotein LolB